MSRKVSIAVEHFPIAGTFTISRGSKTEASVVTCRITEDGASGIGECVPYARYGETIESVVAQIESASADIQAGMGREELNRRMPAGAARNAMDCALWDLEAKKSGATVASRVCAKPPKPLTTAYTISLGEPAAMAAQAAIWSHRTLLKVKVGTPDDRSRIRAVRAAAPASDIILDANEGWTPRTLEMHFDVCVEAGIALIEQPLPSDDDAALASIARPVKICADESVHKTEDLAALVYRYDAVNIKLDKTGGLTEGLRMRAAAQALDLQVMIGCMVGTSLGMAPAVLLAQGADFVDLDGPLLLAKDRHHGLHYDGSLVYPPTTGLWG
ncbi:N-acetyl-D-Glu racemase DgcA [Pararhizobium arenae]|uniref:N-acetyl-D-Glu racemase DgcA n=1 Tax=Pararhizobium arenae TaxID=1856850 RepID=UPI00094B24C7|nr:N-acetyl-D-Glu racemase DgcA [Pararhizobium arenae]